jgi:aminoglycoside phosphotransferase family enzyme/predicted kinase
LGEHDVWKVKKPVSLGFLDFSTPARRLAACMAEVRLNRRLARDVYKGVVPVTIDRNGCHRLRGYGEPVDWAVHMSRLPDVHRADIRLEQGSLNSSHLRLIAERLAAFHERTPSFDATSRYGSVETIRNNISENFAQTADCVRAHLSPSQGREIEAWQREFLSTNEDVLEERISQGRVRAGHGDLRLEHVYVNASGDVTVLDCVEFAERFRCTDVCADAAFLSMDLAWHGRVDLAEKFLASYAESANDYDIYPLVDFYESYLAYVRGKVACILASDQGADWGTRSNAAQQARRFFVLALASKRRPLVTPRMLAVGGMVASGKSTLAEHLGTELAAPVISSDRTRKWLLGIDATTTIDASPWEDAYSPSVTDRVYAELLRRARAVVASGRSVVLDASFRSRAHRGQVRRLAKQCDVPVHFIECRVDRSVCEQRLRARDLRPGVSDARLDMLDEFQSRWQVVDELPDWQHIVVDTSLPVDVVAGRLRRRLSDWPVGLSA